MENPVMAKTSNDNLTRLLNLLPLLKQRDGHKIDAICKELNLSRNELLNEIQQLSALRWGEHEEGDLVDIYLDGEHLRVFSGGVFENALRISPPEMVAINFGAARLKALGLGKHLKALEPTLKKIEKELSAGAPESLDLFMQAVSFRPEASVDERILDQLFAAIKDHHGLLMSYYSVNSDRYSPRSVNPLECLNMGSIWYLRAFDFNRQEIRTFRVDRIGELKDEARNFSPTDYPIDNEGEVNFFGGSSGETQARIKLGGFLAKVAREEKWVVKESINENIWETDYSNPNWLIRMILGVCDENEILAPTELRQQMIDILKDIRNNQL
jgi:proteasome accessory factor BC